MAKFTPVRLAYNQYEPTGAKSEEAPVLFLHGLCSLKEGWLDLPQEIADSSGRTAYSVDFRDHGDSEWSEPCGFDVYADDLLHFMDVHGLAKTVLVGHSMGGLVSYKAALKAPERVEGLFIEDVSTSGFRPEIHVLMRHVHEMVIKVVAQIPPELEERDAVEFFIDHVLKLLPPEAKPTPQMNIEDMKVMVRLRRTDEGRWAFKSNVEGVLKSLQSAEELMQPYKGVYNEPVCVACGDASPLKTFDDGDIIRKHFPKAEIVTFKNAMHGVHLESKEEYRKCLQQFLLKLSSH